MRKKEGNIMKKKLSKRQLDVMKVLWDHSSTMVASDIVNGSPALNINTVQSCLKVLLKENLTEQKLPSPDFQR